MIFVLVLVLLLVPRFREQRSGGAVEKRDMFDHERLDAYRLAIEFGSWVAELLDALPRVGRPGVVRHLDEASASIALNIAEGNGKRSYADRVRYLEIAKGSAFECAACLDILIVRRLLSDEAACRGKMTLVRIVQTITKLIESLLEKRRASPTTSTSTSRSTTGRR